MENEVLPVKLGNRAIKQLKKIRKTDRALYEKVEAGIMAIRIDPEVGSQKKGDLKDYRSLDINHMRTNYELCYTLELNEEGDVVLIILMGPRENFYEDLKRYLNL